MEKTIDSLMHVGSAHSSARRHSTIDMVIRAGYDLPAIRREQRDDLSDVLAGADATQRNIPEPIIRGKSRSRRSKFGGTRRRDNAGRHDVHTDVARREFHRERARVVLKRRLCGAAVRKGAKWHR